MVQAHGHVPLKAHGKTFLRDVPASMRRHHCDERPPRPARRAGYFYGEHKRIREGSSGWECGFVTLLYLITKGLSKLLLPIYDKPMVKMVPSFS